MTASSAPSLPPPDPAFSSPLYRTPSRLPAAPHITRSSARSNRGIAREWPHREIFSVQPPVFPLHSASCTSPCIACSSSLRRIRRPTSCGRNLGRQRACRGQGEDHPTPLDLSSASTLSPLFLVLFRVAVVRGVRTRKPEHAGRCCPRSPALGHEHCHRRRRHDQQ